MNITEEPNPFPIECNRVLAALTKHDISYELRSFDQPARHATEAADLLGCLLGSVIKSLVFQVDQTEDILLVLVSGSNRVDLHKLSQVVQKQVQPLKPNQVHRLTGYDVGAVPCTGFDPPIPVIIDQDLLAFDHLWASAGAVNVLFRITPSDLLSLTMGRAAVIKQV